MSVTGKSLPVVRDVYSPITFRTAFKIIESRFDDLKGDVELLNNTLSPSISINDLADVNTASATDGQVLGYQNTTNSWIPISQTSGGGAVQDATTAIKGIVRLSTVSEVNAGFSTSISITPYSLGLWVGSLNITKVGNINIGSWQGDIIQSNYLFGATELLPGIVEIATQTEVNTGSGSSLVVTADKLVNAVIDGGTF